MHVHLFVLDLCVFKTKCICDNHFTFFVTVEQEKLVEMKRAKESRSDEKLAGNRSANGSEVQTNQQVEAYQQVEANKEEHSFVSPVPPPVRSVSSLVSPVSFHHGQVQAALSPPSPSKESRYLHYTAIYITPLYICSCEF